MDPSGLDRHVYGTLAMRRTKAALINLRTQNLRAEQLLLGHTKLESSLRYLGSEVDDALGLLSKQRPTSADSACRLSSRLASFVRFSLQTRGIALGILRPWIC